MSESLNKIEDILTDIQDESIDILQSEEETITNLNLSSEYDNYKEALINKIDLYIEYLDTNDSTYLEEFSEIDAQEELINSFEDANYQIQSSG